MGDDEGVFYFKFATSKGLEQVLQHGPWLIRNVPIILIKWTPKMTISKDQVTRVPSRVGYARALIEVLAVKELKQEVTISIPNVEEEVVLHTLVKIQVEYEWKPLVCVDCKVFGHVSNQCPKRIPTKVVPTEEAHDIGFTVVKNRKAKGKNVATNQRGNFNGVRINNQKRSSVKPEINSVQGKKTSDCSAYTQDRKEDKEYDSEIKEMVMEENPYTSKPIGARTPYHDVLNVYNKQAQHRLLWRELGVHKNVVQEYPWTLMGDFNVALNMKDNHAGSSSMNSAMCEFKDCASNIEKAKVEWLDVGDSNSAYFHKTIKSKNQRSRIKTILNSDNVDISGSMVPEVFVKNYEQFLGSDIECANLNVEGLFFKTIHSHIAGNMVQNVTKKEIKDAMFVIGDEKDPGPDGFTSLFFKKGWDIIGDDICNAVRDFFLNGKLLKEINQTFLTLIPKTILIRFGFHRTMVKLIMACVTTTSFSQSINGNVHDYFKGKRGLRQGDPLSPYLFTLVMEILPRILHKRVHESANFRFHRHCIIDDIHQLIRGFLWGNGEFIRGKAKVSWEVICLPKSFHLKNKVADLLMNGSWALAQSWLHKAPDLGIIPATVLDISVPDERQWRDRSDMDNVPPSMHEIFLYLKPMGDGRCPIALGSMASSLMPRMSGSIMLIVAWSVRSKGSF
nr:hypothetical protein [Tanacetum cinerariifolium]